MSVGWSGPDPVGFSDGTSANYELGTQYTVNGDITLTHIRVWGHLGGATRTSRVGRIWTSAGVELELVTMADTLPPGWSVYPLITPLKITNGTQFVISYSVTNRYGALTPSPGYPRASTDGLLTATTGRLTTNPPTFPSTLSGTAFYGIDVQYTAGFGGNTAPVVGITAVASGTLSAAATLTITDETPGTVTYAIEWGDGQVTLGLSSLGPHIHTYAAAGTYAIMVTATDDGGLTDSASTLITINPPTGSDLILYQCSAALLTYVKAQLAATTAGLPANVRSCVVPGQLAWDCCELVAVEWIGNFFTNSLPSTAQETDDGCTAMLGMTFRVTALRCSPQPDDSGDPPTCVALDAAAQIQFVDALAVTRGVAFASKALEDANTVLSYAFGGAVPTGPQGGCVGVTMDVSYGVLNNVGAC